MSVRRHEGDRLLASTSAMFDRLVERLDGLDDHEYLWEPVADMWSVRADASGVVAADGAGVRDIDPAPVTTIAWRTWHLARDCFDDYRRRFGGDGAAASPRWTLSADEAVSRLRTDWDGYRTSVAERGWDVELGLLWGPFADATTFDMLVHATNELVHHGAEIALLRDLYGLSGPRRARL